MPEVNTSGEIWIDASELPRLMDAVKLEYKFENDSEVNRLLIQVFEADFEIRGGIATVYVGSCLGSALWQQFEHLVDVLAANGVEGMITCEDMDDNRWDVVLDGHKAVEKDMIYVRSEEYIALQDAAGQAARIIMNMREALKKMAQQTGTDVSTISSMAEADKYLAGEVIKQIVKEN